MSRHAPALLPAALLACLTLWCGSFHGAATATGAIGHQSLVLLFCLLAPVWWDPLDLGRSGRLLLAATLSVALVSWAVSPVGRAGVVGLTLLPAYLLLPGAATRCWQTAGLRRVGALAIAWLTLVVSILALIRWQTLALPRASLPLGHHNLLAGWLVLVLPVALCVARFPGTPRVLGVATGSAGLMALAATGSLWGLVGVTVQAIVAAVWWKRLRPWIGAGLVVVATISLPRILSIVHLTDSSMLARLSYLEAGWRGLLSRGALGWGPGAVPWTVGRFLRPREGLHPASQVVGDLHSLPMQWAYELGFVGILLILATSMTFALRRAREIEQHDDPVARRAALLGLAGGAFFSLGSAAVSVPALPAAAAVVAGMAMRPRPATPFALRGPWAVAYLVAAIAILVPLNRAHLQYDRARNADTAAENLQAIDRARHLDPAFPLYLARYAWSSGDSLEASAPNARLALRAAKMAPGLAPLWLAAGDLGRRSAQPWATLALRQAQELDPLSPLTAFHVLTTAPEVEGAAEIAQWVVSREPRLAAANWWWDHPDFAERVSQLAGVPIPLESGPWSIDPQVLAATLDRTPAISFSLFAFRRSPWPARLAPVDLGRSATPSSQGPHPDSRDGIQ